MRLLVLGFLGACLAAEVPPALQSALNRSCAGCHTGKEAKAGLDLTSLPWAPANRANRERWVRVHDRVERGEMPPKGVPFAAGQRSALLGALRPGLEAADRADVAKNGRGPLRRLNRDEYEQNLRDVLHLPNLDIRDMLPEDREAYHFNKVSETLDMSRVQLTAYLDASETALRQAMVTTAAAPPVEKKRIFGAKLFPGTRSTGERESMFFLRGDKGFNVEKPWGKPWTKEELVDETIEMGLFRSPGWPYGAFPQGYKTPAAGMYKIRFEARAVLQQPGYVVTEAKRPVPMMLRSRRPTNHDIAEDVKAVGGILEIQPGRKVYEVTVYLPAGQTVEYGLLGLPVPQVDAYPDKPGSYRFPAFPEGGAPGVVFKWIEFEGPLAPAAWPPASHRVLFDELGVNPRPGNPRAEAARLLRRFVGLAARGPVAEETLRTFEQLIYARLDKGEAFAEAMLAGYQAVLCSNVFLYLPEPREQYALASRLSHFLRNSRPDGRLMELARAGRLREAGTLRAETERLIAGEGFERFVRAFTGYWLNLRSLRRDDADKRLYPEYQLDEYLVESMERETLGYFTAMVRENLPARAVVDSDFVLVNERLAKHYGLPEFVGAGLRKVSLPKASVLGGLLTQGAILKVTSNGTSTSPVIRGAWITDRILGEPPPPPPPGVPAVEPDIRGAKTIRDLLDLHKKAPACASCHLKFDPVGLALENFDVMGKFRTRYRGVEEGERVSGIDHTGHDFAYTIAGEVDASGKLADGRAFRDIRELKAILAGNPRQLARNLVQQFTVYATGTPVRFSDRAEVERILDGCAAGGYRVKDLLHGVVQSRIFQGGMSR